MWKEMVWAKEWREKPRYYNFKVQRYDMESKMMEKLQFQKNTLSSNHYTILKHLLGAMLGDTVE